MLRVHFFHSDKPREHLLADAVLRGAAKHGCSTSASPIDGHVAPGSYDVACFVGVKWRVLYRRHHAAGVHVVMFDKGYARHKSSGPVGGWEFWRVAVDAHQPTRRAAVLEMPSDRFDALHLEVHPWRKRGEHVLFAGSSAKYHAFHGLKPPTAYARAIVRDLRRVTERSIWYRPKPSWREAEPVPKSRYCTAPETIADALRGAWCMVTHGSNACFEAMLAGIPSIVLGDAVARPISSTDVADIESPRVATNEERLRLLRNLAYFQWTHAEFADGTAWEFLGGEIHK